MKRRSLEERLNLFHNVVDNINEGIAITDLQGVVLFVNQGFTRITGYSFEEIIGKTPSVLKSGRYGPEFYKKFWDSLREKGEWQGEIWNKKKSGEIYPEFLIVKSIAGASGEANYYLAILNDISYLKRFEKRMRTELMLARQIQINLMPKHYPDLKGYSFYGIYQPMEEVGGDFYDLIELKEQKSLGIFISDISGHGIPAALITSMLKTMLETSQVDKSQPAGLLKYLNENLAGLASGNFLTCFYGVLNLETKTMTYSRAGHPFPLLVRNQEITELSSKGKVLGFFDAVEIEEKTIQLNPGDKILFYTDGLTEALNSQGIEFQATIHEIIAQNSEKKIKPLIESIYYQLLLHCETDIFEDDLCLLGLEVEL